MTYFRRCFIDFHIWMEATKSLSHTNQETKLSKGANIESKPKSTTRHTCNSIRPKSIMASSSSSSSGTACSKKRLPEGLTELLDVAIFTFACQAGLRTGHKVRGDPVLRGVSAFFGQLLQTANEETRKLMKDISPERLGGWQPGEAPSPKLLTLVSSRIKTLKSKQLIREDANPVVPSLLVERIDRFDEEEERVRTTTLARCWSCQSRCKSCLQKKTKFLRIWELQNRVSCIFIQISLSLHNYKLNFTYNYY